jgi:hypothetical protein
MPCLILQAAVPQDKCEVTFMIHLQKFGFSKCILTIRSTFCCIYTTCVYVYLPPMYNEFSILQVSVVPDCPQGGVKSRKSERPCLQRSIIGDNEVNYWRNLTQSTANVQAMAFYCFIKLLELTWNVQ